MKPTQKRQNFVFFSVLSLLIVMTFLFSKSKSMAEEGLLVSPTPKIGQIVHQGSPLPNLKKYGTMNGIELTQLDRFWEKWKLVNVRYRTDTGEQRFVYADPIAWKALQRGDKVFPKGAMFGKVAFSTVSDPSFPVSLEPTEFTRAQIMKRDAKAYADTGGWGYALVLPFNQNTAAANKGQEKQMAVSCHACHRLAEKKDYIFTQTPFAQKSILESGLNFKNKFTKKLVDQLTEMEKKALNLFMGDQKLPASIQYYSMDLFEGSIHESIPVVSKYGAEGHDVFLLSDPKSNHFIFALSQKGKCSLNAKLLFTSSGAGLGLNPTHVINGTLCGGDVKWDQARPF